LKKDSVSGLVAQRDTMIFPQGKEDKDMGQWAWTFDTLTAEERSEYDSLQEQWQEAEMEQRYESQKEIEQRINAFIDRMNNKYGEYQ